MGTQEADFIVLSKSSPFHFPNGFPYKAQNIPQMSHEWDHGTVYSRSDKPVSAVDVVMIETLPTLLVVNSLP